MAKNEGRIWKPTQEEEFLAGYHMPERKEEGVLIYPNRWHYPELGGIHAVKIVSRGKAEVFLRKGKDEEDNYHDEICLIRRGLPIQATPRTIVIPAEGLGVKKEALIIFQEVGETANIFLRVNGKFTAEARIECQQTK